MDLLREISNLKERAMLFRDDGDYADAIETLHEAEQRILAELASIDMSSEGPGHYERSLRKQLYSIRGSRGGVYRRWQRLPEAIAAYDAGHDIERDFLDSYNLTQRLVTRVMLDPSSPDRAEFRASLTKAADTIRGQMRADEYAAADLLTILLLLGDPAWRDALQQFVRLAEPSSYARKVTKQLFEELSAHVVANTPLYENLQAAVTRL